MKIALCLHGLTNGVNHNSKSISIWTIGLHWFKKEIVDNPLYDVDVFLHSPNDCNKQFLIDHYKPSYYILGDDSNKKQFNVYKKYSRMGRKHSFSCILSNLYSQKKVHQLCLNYSKKNNIKYDLVINTRFDFLFHHIKPLNVYSPEKFHILDNSPDKLTVNEYLKSDVICDYIFISNPQLMSDYVKIYDNIEDIGKKHGYDTHVHQYMRLYINTVPSLVDNLTLIQYNEIMLQPGKYFRKPVHANKRSRYHDGKQLVAILEKEMKLFYELKRHYDMDYYHQMHQFLESLTRDQLDVSCKAH